ncbi:MAG: hypothetical protein ABJA78_03200 [Ferruginibacter sp.]
MKLKNFLRIAALVVMIAIVNPVSSFAMPAKIAAIAGDPEKDAKTLADITRRVNEIQNMDKENLTGSEKKALRSELKDMKNQASTLDRKVYLSVGAIIIIILLLILILR